VDGVASHLLVSSVWSADRTEKLAVAGAKGHCFPRCVVVVRALASVAPSCSERRRRRHDARGARLEDG
jgi:hypothetical protein